MDPEDLKRRHVRKPKPESKVDTVSRYWAYDAQGQRLGDEPVLLSRDSKKRYEERGFVFKSATGGIWY